MGKVYKFAETELQHSGASPRFMYIDVLPEQEGEHFKLERSELSWTIYCK